MGTRRPVDSKPPGARASGGTRAPGGRVIVRIERFIGHGAHIHVSMGERYMKFRDRHRALQWVEATFRSEFDPATQELVFAEGATRRWFYGEGD